MSIVISNEGNDTLFVDSIFVEDTLSGFSVSISESRTSGRIGAMVQENYFSSSVFINPFNPIDGSEKSDNVSKNKNNSIQKNNQKVTKQNSIKVASVAKIDRTDTATSSFKVEKNVPAIPLVEDSRNNRMRLWVHVMPGESIGLDVTFARSDTATVSTTLEITSDDPLGNEGLSLPLTAQSVSPILYMSDMSYQFGNVLEDSIYTISLSNIGTDTLNISNANLVYLTPLSVDVFSQSWDETTQNILAPGDITDVSITFSPELDGRYILILLS